MQVNLVISVTDHDWFETLCRRHDDLEEVNFRAEGLDAHWFMNFDDALYKMEGWRRDCSEAQLYRAVDNKPPIALQYCLGAILLP